MNVKNSLQITRATSGTYDDDGRAKRTGNLKSAVAHIITAVIGSGVLSLAWSMAQFGWIGGPVALLSCAIATYISSFLLSDCYRNPDPITGKRNYSFTDAVRVNLENGRIMGSVTGVQTANVADKIWLIFQALGDISFSYPYAMLLLEIQDTLESPPAENQTMKKASMIAIFITTFFYLCCGCFGYAAFGNAAPGNLLTGFGFYEPFWLIDIVNVCIIIHLVGGYQIFSQPIYRIADKWCSRKFPNNGFVNDFHRVKLPLLPAFEINLYRFCFRTVYVISTTGLAVLFPYFNQVIGVLGCINFWPLAIYFPVEMYFEQMKIGVWTRKWIILRIFSFACFLVTMVGLIGSFEGIIREKLSKK